VVFRQGKPSPQNKHSSLTIACMRHRRAGLGFLTDVQLLRVVDAEGLQQESLGSSPKINRCNFSKISDEARTDD
jgi:hypothetical protein